MIIYGEPATYFAEVFMTDWAPQETYETPDDDYNKEQLLIPLALAAALLYLKRRK